MAREAAERFLRSRGHPVTSARNGEEALRAATREAPDVLVCDWSLGPGLDGVEVARNLQRRFNVFVIFVTAHPLHELRATTGDLRVASYFRKPVSLPVLADTVGRLTQ